MICEEILFPIQPTWLQACKHHQHSTTSVRENIDIEFLIGVITMPLTYEVFVSGGFQGYFVVATR